MKHLLYLALGLCLALVSELAQAQTWVSLNGPQIASQVRDISVTTSGNYLYIADANYVLKSTNAGTAWAVTPQPYSNPLLVLVKPNDSTKVLAAMNGEVAYNANGGAGQWLKPIEDEHLTPLRLVAAVNDATKMLLGKQYHPQSIYSIYRSVDGGANWNPASGFTFETHITDFAAYPNNTSGWAEGIVWAGGTAPTGTPGGSSNSSVANTNGLWVSTDYGLTWSADRLGNRNVRTVALVPKTYTTSYIRLVADNVPSGNDVLLRNINIGSDVWTEIPLSPAPADIYLIRRKNSNGYLFLATSNGVWRSTNEGESFQRIAFAGTDVLSIAVSSTGNIVFAGTATTLYKSTNNGDTWENVGDMDVSSVTAAQVGSTQYAWAVTKDNNIGSRHNGTSWDRRTIGAEGGSFSTENIYRHPATGKLFAVGAEGNVARVRSSANNGDDYNAVSYTYSLQSGSRYHAITTAPSGTMYLAGGGNLSSGGTGWRNLFNSLDNGATWNVINSIGSAGLWIYNIAAASGSTLYAAGSNGSVYRSTNGGTNWSSVTTVGSVARNIAVNPNNPNVVYAGGSGGIKKTTDGGGSWSTIRSDNVMKVMMHPSYQNSFNYLLAVGSGGGAVFETSTGDANWSQHTGLETPIRSLGADLVGNGNMYAATTGGVYRINPPPIIVTGVQSAPSGGRPGISWNPSPESDLAASPYRVYRYYRYCEIYFPHKQCGGPVETSLLAQTTATSYVDSTWYITTGPNLDDMRIAGYYVKAVDTGGNESEQSAVVEFTVGVPYGCCLKQPDGTPALPEAYGIVPFLVDLL